MAEVDNPGGDNESPAVVAPPGEQPASTPAPVDPTASEGEPVEGEVIAPKPADQDRKTSRAFASLRRQIVERDRIIGRLQGQSEAQAPQQPAAPADAAPKQEDYATFNDYLAAVVQHATVKGAQTVAKEFDGRVTRAQQEQAAAKSGDTFWNQAARDAKAAGIENFDEAAAAIKTGEVVTSPPMSHYVIEVADNKPQLVAWLADNPEESERIAGLDPVRAGAELRKVDLALGGKRPPAVSRAPAPVPQPTGGGGTAPQSIERMSHADIVKLTGKWNRAR